VVSSVYPGSPYAVAAAKSDLGSAVVQSRNGARWCHGQSFSGTASGYPQVAAVDTVPGHLCVLIDIWTTAR